MKQSLFKVIGNKQIAKNTYEMVLSGDTTNCKPGQFVNIQIKGKYLRRPISVCNAENGKLTLIYKVVGSGTSEMATYTNETLDVLHYLGNGYNLEKAGNSPVLIGGGAGIPPLYMLAKELIKDGKEVQVILGFNSKEEIFYVDEFKALGAKVYVTTVDGSEGIKGFVTDALKEIDYTYFYTCGPEPMLKAIFKASTTEGQMSFEERMGCGFGACMGCSCKTITGYKRICKDGPVLEKGEIIW